MIVSLFVKFAASSLFTFAGQPFSFSTGCCNIFYGADHPVKFREVSSAARQSIRGVYLPGGARGDGKLAVPAGARGRTHGQHRTTAGCLAKGRGSGIDLDILSVAPAASGS